MAELFRANVASRSQRIKLNSEQIFCNAGHDTFAILSEDRRYCRIYSMANRTLALLQRKIAMGKTNNYSLPTLQQRIEKDL